MIKQSEKTILQHFIKVFDVLMDEYLKSLIVNNRASYESILYKYGVKKSGSLSNQSSQMKSLSKTKDFQTKESTSF